MIPCRECGKMISDQAVNCPHCGSPNASSNSQTKIFNNKKVNDPNKNTNPRKPTDQRWLYALLGVLATALVGLGLWSWQAGLFSSDDKEKGKSDTTVVVVHDSNPAADEPPATPSQPAAPTFVYANSYDGFVNIRQSASARSAILDQLYNDGAPATLISSSGKWYKVKYNGVVGYVKGEYVKVGGSTHTGTSAKASKVYYVVIGSWENLQTAKASYGSMPDFFDNGDIYKAYAKGKVVYRMVIEEHSTRSEAQQAINTYKEVYGDRFWIWESDGPAQLVYRP